jgi:addiction module HigA family antidote
MTYILKITIKGLIMTKVRPSTHPGIILREEFAEPLALTQAKMAADLGVGIKTLSELYNKKRGISAIMALKLARYFGTTPQFWMTLQDNYDLYQAYMKESSKIDNVPVLETAS